MKRDYLIVSLTTILISLTALIISITNRPKTNINKQHYTATYSTYYQAWTIGEPADTDTDIIFINNVDIYKITPLEQPAKFYGVGVIYIDQGGRYYAYV